jgi:HAD superfamily hydrolase (TIGR01549 family)
MLLQPDNVRALTFDFYGTLVYPRHGQGRGARLMEYLAQHELASDPWEHQVLYDVFGACGHRYSPWFSPAEQAAFEADLARSVFDRLRVQAPGSLVAQHANALWNILGPAGFAVFPEVANVLAALEQAGYPLVIISNWQAGLSGFCQAFGLGHAFGHVLASAEVGSAKPEAGIFLEAASRLSREPGEILHVGDTYRDDYEGATAVGFKALLLTREPSTIPNDAETITTLDGLITRLELA